MCSYLASFPAALTHAFIARYSRPGDVVLDPFSGRGTTPLQACAEGRIGVGNDLNPFAHLLTAAKVEPATRAAGDDPAGRAPAGLERRARADWLALGRARSRRTRRDRRRLVPAAGSGGSARRRRRAGPGRGRAGLPPADARPAAVRPDRRSASTIATDRFLAAALTGILHGKSATLPVRADAEHVQHGAALRPRLRRPDGVRVARARRLRRPRQEARPALPRSRRRRSRGSPCSATPATSAPRARAALRARGRPDRARLVVTSPPYLRVVKYGYYNWLRTWFLGFDARAIDAALDDAHHREPYLAVPARRPRRPPAGPGRRRRRRPRHRRRRDRPRAARSAAASASPSGSGRPPPSPRATASPGSPSTTSRPAGR